MKRTLFRIHSWLGLALGLVLAVIGATGAMLAFEDEITDWLAPAYIAPGTPAAPDLALDTLAARIEARFPGYRINRIEWNADRRLSYRVRLTRENREAPSEARHDPRPSRITGQVDRASGAWLPEPGVVRAFATIERLHRWLALPGNGDGPGRTITFLGALALLGFAATGLALRWPRTRRQWRKLLILDLRQRKGRLRNLHRTVGTWLLPLYLLSALTGLWWGSATYQAGLRLLLTGQTEKAERAGSAPNARPGQDHGRDHGKAHAPPPWHADAAWAALARMPAATTYVSARILMTQGGKVVRIEALPQGARHPKQVDSYAFDARSGAVLEATLYKDVPTGQRITDAILQIHKGAYFGLAGRIALFASSLFLPFFAVSGLLFWWQRRPRRTKRPHRPASPPSGALPPREMRPEIAAG